MKTLVTEMRLSAAQNIKVTADELMVELIDGRTITIPLVWYPRLYHGAEEERNNWQLMGVGAGIHWPDLDEDISIEHILMGVPSGESQKSFQRWLDDRNAQIERGTSTPNPALT